MEKRSIFLSVGLSILMITTIGCSIDKDNAVDSSLTNGIDIESAVGHEHDKDKLKELCAGEIVDQSNELIEMCKKLAVAYYKDTKDGGNNIFKPGCHLMYNNANCPAGQGKVFRSSGDLCQSQTRIAEWTNPKCHPAKPNDSSKFDCDAECKKKGANAGTCVTVKNFCAKGINSAKCECIVL